MTKFKEKESINVADNGQILGFRALMGRYGMRGSRVVLLANEGMAEYFWGMLPPN
ncbi:hypothetical protein QVN60_04045 [Yersinia aleksiciae]|uniref:hypothetical protein n=1 Tax=Yersinia aleksiciae TaxID=263819 RepID=UPI0025AA41ED|nr:hypothetical protein [Yersinia aleksiciae]MDN0122383.1 hypothetical protein [Yersinia aleksiciae]